MNADSSRRGRASTGPCLAYRIAIGLFVLGTINVVVAVGVGMHVFNTLGETGVLPAWASMLDTPLSRWHARDSGLGVGAAVYYACVLPLLPVSFVATSLLAVYERDGQLKSWITRRRDAKGVLSTFAMLLLGPALMVSFVWLFDGGNSRYTRFANDVSATVSQGWVLFMFFGAIGALGPCAARILWSQRR